jgi:excisionase family DNA binding protein
MLTVKQVSELLQAKQSTVYAWAEQCRIPCFKINGLLRFDEREIETWIKACKKNQDCYNGLIQARARKGG